MANNIAVIKAAVFQIHFLRQIELSNLGILA